MTVLSNEGIKKAGKSELIQLSDLEGNPWHLRDEQYQGASIEISGSRDGEIWRRDYRTAFGKFKPLEDYAEKINPDDGNIVLWPGQVTYVQGPVISSDFDIDSQGRSTLGRHFVEAAVVADSRKYIPGDNKPRQTWIELVSHVHPIRINPTENLAHLIFHSDNQKIPEDVLTSIYGKRRGFGFYEDLVEGKDRKYPVDLIPLDKIRHGSSIRMTLAGDDIMLTKPSERIVDFKGKASLEELEEELYHTASLENGKIVLSPGDRVLASTNEVTRLSGGFMGMMGDYSPYADLHPHASAGIGDPGFTGTYTLEIMYNGPTKLMLKEGMPVADYVVHALDEPTKVTYGSEKSKSGENQYQGQKGTTLPKRQSKL